MPVISAVSSRPWCCEGALNFVKVSYGCHVSQIYLSYTYLHPLIPQRLHSSAHRGSHGIGFLSKTEPLYRS